MIRSCASLGGLSSQVSLPRAPVLEEELLLDETAGAALRLWRARPGEIVTVVDPSEICYRARLTALEPRPRLVPFARLSRPMESRLTLEVFQALPSRERFELVLQKLTELGVSGIIPVETERSTTLSERDALQAKSRSWPAVVRRAARQCRRARLPVLTETKAFDVALAMSSGAELKLLLYEGEECVTLVDAVGSLRPQSVALMIGPEGGFSETEVAVARLNGYVPVTLGPRLLRTETAAITGTALLQGMLGDLL